MAGLKGITVNTKPEDVAHIFSEDDAAIYESIVGPDGVMDVGQKCMATIIDNNTVRIADGVICVGGHFARIPYGEFVDCKIANGQSGMYRNDFIVVKFSTTGNGGVDAMTCEVKQGQAGVVAEDPNLVQDNIYEAGLTREFPLYRVRVEGISLAGVDKLFEEIKRPTIRYGSDAPNNAVGKDGDIYIQIVE